MAEILRNQVLNLIPDVFPIGGLVRILWLHAALDRVVFIPVDQMRRKPPQALSLTKLQAAMERGQALVTPLKPDPRSLMSDAQLTTLYPPGKSGQMAFPLAYRAHWWSVIEPIVLEAERYFKGQCSLGCLINLQAQKLGVSRQRIYLVLYRYWAAGSVTSALLPDSSRCGGKGKRRSGKRVHLGRKSLAAKLAASANDNYALGTEDIERLQFGWRSFLGRKVTVRAAYERTLSTFYVRDWEMRDGKAYPNLKPARELPSLAQFRYHGERQEGGQKAWKCHLSEKEWHLNHRPLAGTPGVGHGRIGAVGQADASTNDVHLVSVFDRLKIVGPCHWVLIVDEFSGMIVGLYVGWSVDGEAAKLAMLSATSSKVDFCARYGIHITEDDFPKVFFNALVVDRGEFNTEDVRTAFSAIGSSLEYVQTGRGDLKPQVEGKHHVLHALSSHQLPGTTRGKRRERGDPEPALDACLNIHEYTADLIRAVLHHNTKQPAPKQLTTEMKQDGVLPTRISIWQWAKKKGYVAYKDCEEDRLISHLCPEIEAVVQPDGIRLLCRNDSTGGHQVTVNSVRYLGTIAERHNWLETARRRGTFRIRLYHNPYDLRRVWYLDPEFGLQELNLVTSDPLLGELATLKDLLVDHSALTLRTQDAEHQASQSRMHMALDREATVHIAKGEKKAFLKALDRPPSKRQQLADRRGNRSDEIQRTGKALAAFSPQDPPPISNQPLSKHAVLGTPSDWPRPIAEVDPSKQAIEEWLSGEETP